jgi:AcrR family transcriptional regulator
MGVPHRPVPLADTSEQILDIAQFLVQTRGFNAFSYADIASQLGIRNAAVHYHFRSKTDLGHALVVRYRQTFARALATIDAEVGVRQPVVTKPPLNNTHNPKNTARDN